MHALNTLHLLDEIDINSNIEVRYIRYKHCDSIEIYTEQFKFLIDEYGSCSLTYGSITDSQHDSDYWSLIKNWVKNYITNTL